MHADAPLSSSFCPPYLQRCVFLCPQRVHGDTDRWKDRDGTGSPTPASLCVQLPLLGLVPLHQSITPSIILLLLADQNSFLVRRIHIDRKVSIKPRTLPYYSYGQCHPEDVWTNMQTFTEKTDLLWSKDFNHGFQSTKYGTQDAGKP